MSAPLSGVGDGGSPTIVAQGQVGASTLALDGPNLYWVNSGSGNYEGSVMRCSKTSCANSPTVVACNQNNSMVIAVDGSHVYWTNFGSEPSFTDGTVMKILK